MKASISTVTRGWLLLSVGALLTAATSIPHAETITWDNLAGGSWNSDINWNPLDVPDEAGEDALIADDGSSYIISLNMSPSLDSVSFLNPGATLNLSSQTLSLLTASGLTNAGLIQANSGNGTIAGSVLNQPGGVIQTLNSTHLSLTGPTVTNNGVITINPLGGSGSSNLYITDNISLDGNGELRLVTSGQINDAEIETSEGFVLTQQANHQILGAGTIRGEFINYGTVTADETGHTLSLALTSKINHGTMSAAADCILSVGDITVAQGPTGMFIGDEGTVKLLGGAIITGGGFSSNGTGAVQTVSGTVTLTDVENAGLFNLLHASAVNLHGTETTNTGTIILNPNGSSSNSILRFSENVTLMGNGELQMVAASHLNDSQISSIVDMVGTNGPGHTIRGAGTISASLINEGLISGDATIRPLLLNTNPKTNRATMQAVDGGQLTIDGCEVTQDPGGEILADNGVVNVLTGATITGGELRAVNGGEFDFTDGIVYLNDLSNNALCGLRGGATARITGQIINNGTFVLNSNLSSSNAFLIADNNTTLPGSGTVRMQVNNSVGDAVINSAADVTITQGADHSIRGTGTISAALISEGIVSADSSFYQLKLTDQPKINRGEMRTETDATLWISSCEVTQENAGRIVADSGMVTLGGASIAGGTLNTENGGHIRCQSGYSDLTDVVNNGSLQISGSNGITVYGDTFTNEGLIEINYANQSSNAALIFGEETTLNGSGEILLETGSTDTNDASIKTIGNALVTIGPDQLIHGSGSLSGRMINQGTILADFAGTTDLDCDSDSLVNQSLMRAENGGDLTLRSGELINQAMITAIDTSRVLVDAGTLTNAGDLLLLDESTLRIVGGQVINENLITAGELGRIHQTAGIVFNHGTIRAEASGTILIDSGSYRSDGLTDVIAGGSYWSDRMSVSGHYTGSTLKGGTWRVEAGGEMRLIGCNTQTLQAGVVLSGAGSMIYSDNSTTDALAGLNKIETGGFLEIQNGRDFTTAGDLANEFGGVSVGEACQLTVQGAYSHTGNVWSLHGLMQVDGTFSSTAALIELQGGILSGSGTVADTVMSTGWVEPGSPIGALTVASDYSQTGAGTLHIMLGGTDPGESDQLIVDDLADLGGTLIVQSIESYTPQPGDLFTVLTCGSRVNQFDVTAGAPGYGLTYEVNYYADRVEIEIVTDLSAVPDTGIPDEIEETDENEDPPLAGQLPQAIQLYSLPAGNGVTTIRLELPGAAEIDLRVFDLNGRQLAELASERAEAGIHDYTWRGTSATGQRLPSGIYLISSRVRSGDGLVRRTARIPLIW